MVLGEESVLFREVSLFQGCPYRGVPLYNTLHTLSSVVMARVAMLRLVSDMRFSRSTLHDVTASG